MNGRAPSRTILCSLVLLALGGTLQASQPTSAPAGFPTAGSDAAGRTSASPVEPTPRRASLTGAVVGSPTTAPAEGGSGVRGTIRQLRRADLAPLSSDGGAADLERAIRELNAVLVLPKPQETPAPSPSSRPAPAPVATTQVTSAPVVVKTATTQPAAVVRGLSPETLEQLRTLAPKGVASPLELADALYRIREHEAAAVLYAQAMEQESPAEDKAWALFQMGNCLREKDPARAMEAFKKLLAEQPNSQWSVLAGVQSQVIEWQSANKPAALLEDVARTMTGQEPTPTTGPASRPAVSR